MSPKSRTDAALHAFTSPGGAPSATFPLVLTSTVVAVLALHLDAVVSYSETAFWAGIGLTVAFAALIGRVVGATPDLRSRLALSLGMPAICGSIIGVVVQGLVLLQVGTGWDGAIRDLGGLVDTTAPVPWLASGIVLGGAPALLVSAFLVVTARALRRVTGHDAGERFAVPFLGAAGLAAMLALLVVRASEAAPLVVVALLSALSLIVACLVDGSRMHLLRAVFAGEDEELAIVPIDTFGNRRALLPLVASAAGTGDTSVLVRMPLARASYRAAAAEPIALVADTAEATLLPLRRRRTAAALMLGAMLFASGIAASVQASVAILGQT